MTKDIMGDALESSVLRTSETIGGALARSIAGTSNPDVLLGDPTSDVIDGLEGNDLIFAGAGNDLVLGYQGDDTIFGEDGHDSLRGNRGDDVIFGAAGWDRIKGQDGNDLLDGGDNPDTVNGGAGRDTVIGGAGDDLLLGGRDNDAIIGGTGIDLIFGEGGHDDISGGDEGDIIDGGKGDDTINGDGGADFIFGAQGYDLIDGGDGGDFILAGQEGDTVHAGDGLDHVRGGAGNDSIDGEAGDDLIGGDDGDDTLEGGTGNDTILGGDGVDTAVFEGSVTDYDIQVGGRWVIVTDLNTADGDDGVDQLIAVEQLQFSDASYSLTANNAPVVLVQGPYTYSEDTPFTAMIDVIELDGDVFTIPLIGLSAHLPFGAPTPGLFSLVGPLSVPVGVGFEYSFELDPRVSFNGLAAGESATFTMTVNAQDTLLATGLGSAEFTITGVNDAPDADTDLVTVDEDSGANTVTVLTNDTDPDLNDSLVVTSVGTAQNGVVALNAGVVTYTPNVDFFGNDNFSYTVSDGNGGTSSASVYITVNQVQDDPRPANDTVSVVEDFVVRVDVLDNDVEVDGDTLFINSVTTPGNGTAVIAAGQIDYTPDDDFFGEDSFSYEVADGQGGVASATVTVTVTPENDAPVTTGLTLTRLEEDGTFTIDLGPQVSDAENDPLTFSNIEIVRDAPAVAFTELGNGQISIDPVLAGLETGESLTTTLTYDVSDGQGGSSSGTVVLTIEGYTPPPPPNQAPVSLDPTLGTVLESDGLIEIQMADLASDPNTGDVLTISNLRVTINGTSYSVPFSGGVTSGEGGALAFDPSAFPFILLGDGTTTSLTMTYELTDEQGLADADGGGTITLDLTTETPTVANIAPTAGDLPAGVGAEPLEIIIDDPLTTSYTVNLGALVTDPDAGPNPLVVTTAGFLIGTDEATGAQSFVGSFNSTNNELTVNFADLSIADGESATYSATYTVTDGVDTATGNVVFTFVNPLDNPPTGPVQTTYDFEDFDFPSGSSGAISTLDTFTLIGAASVIETDELPTDRGANSFIATQTTAGGANVMSIMASTIQVQQFDGETGLPLKGDQGQDIFIEELDEYFGLSATSNTLEIDPVLGSSLGFAGPGLGDVLLEDRGYGGSFDLNGMSLGALDGAYDVTIRLYTTRVEETVVNASFSTYAMFIDEVDSFVFSLDSSSGPLALDFEASDFGVGLTGANDDPTEFDDVLYITIETPLGEIVVIDDLVLTA